MKRTPIIALSIVLVGALSACDRAEEAGPPNLRFGRDECAECKMSIVDEKSAAAARIRTSHGTEALMFDDIGCLLDLERWKPQTQVTERWTRDYGSRAWTQAETATYVFSERIHTPMGSWIAAYAAPADAAAAQAVYGGDVLTFEQLVARRAAWMEERYGKREP
ncbi:MAG: nitrous oxide reductase accessory protein NosL [Phycisphaeraceae bacterium]|nr:nitrous oxide reductase accessory protein NosL [Phycisphaeraceae bacterium]